jgi:hypothetical protein
LASSIAGFAAYGQHVKQQQCSKNASRDTRRLRTRLRTHAALSSLTVLRRWLYRHTACACLENASQWRSSWCCRTLISQDGILVTALAKQQLPSSSFALGPLGNLLLRGEPVPAGAAFTATGQLVTADGQVLHMLPGSGGYDDGAPCSGQETLE